MRKSGFAHVSQAIALNPLSAPVQPLDIFSQPVQPSAHRRSRSRQERVSYQANTRSLEPIHRGAPILISIMTRNALAVNVALYARPSRFWRKLSGAHLSVPRGPPRGSKILFRPRFSFADPGRRRGRGRVILFSCVCVCVLLADLFSARAPEYGVGKLSGKAREME